MSEQVSEQVSGEAEKTVRVVTHHTHTTTRQHYIQTYTLLPHSLIMDTSALLRVATLFTIFLPGNAVKVPLLNMGSSYSASLRLESNGTSQSGEFVLDTSSSYVTIKTDNMNISNVDIDDSPCRIMQYDQSSVSFYSRNCSFYSALIGFSNDSDSGSSGKNVSSDVYEADWIDYEDNALHQWDNSTGMLGLGYTKCKGSDCFNITRSPFQMLLENQYHTTLFGLDFNNISSTSVMDIGELNSMYDDSFEWAPRQISTFPQYYEFTLNDLLFCDVHVMANMSTAWQSRVDTGSACLTLPAEIYNNVLSWLDLTIEVEDLNRTYSNEDVLQLLDLPSLSFTINESGEPMRISLKDLLIDSSELVNVPDSPEIFLASGGEVISSNLRMCMLSSTYVDSTSSKLLPPEIVLGSLALRSLYVGFDFDESNPRIGFANKRAVDSSTKGQCAAPVTCIGSQYPNSHHNSCRNPDCRKYFYAAMNEDTYICEYDKGSIVVGIIFIVIFASWEIVAFFVSQYTSHTLIPESSRKFSVDIVTLKIGEALTNAVDILLVDIVRWMPEGYNHNGGLALTPQPEGDLDQNAVDENLNSASDMMFLNFDEAYRHHLWQEMEENQGEDVSIDEGDHGESVY